MKQVYIIALITFGLLISFSTSAQLHISSNTTWSTNQILTQEVIIDPGIKLTIEEGILIQTVFVDTDLNGIGDVGITVNGELEILGSSSSPVIIEPYDVTTDDDYWYGVIINSVTDNNSIDYLTIKNANIGLHVYTSATIEGLYLNKCHYGTIVENTGILNLRHSTIEDQTGTGIFNLDGFLVIENTTVRDNGKFGIVNSSGSLSVDTCLVDSNQWGGIFIGGLGSTTVLNSDVINNTGSGFEISEYNFSSDFESFPGSEGEPDVTVNHCNIYGNSTNYIDLDNTTNSSFMSISDWGTCGSPRPANDGESDVFEIPIGFISTQTVTGLRTYFTSSSYNRNYYLRRAYDDQNIDNYIHSSTTPVSCGTYVPKTFSFSATSVPTDRYYWYIGANSTSSHAIYNPNTTIRLGGYEVYSTVENVHPFDFTGNYWGVVSNVGDLVLDVDALNIDYSGYSTEELDPLLENYPQPQHITTNTIWDRDTTITQMIFIDNGASLTIYEGVHVYVAYTDINTDGIGECGIEVNGELIVQGTNCSPVVFKPIESTTNQHYWTGIVINSSGINNQNINYLETQYAHIGVEIQTTTNINGAKLLKSGDAGLYIDLQSSSYNFTGDNIAIDSTEHTGIFNMDQSVSTIKKSYVSNSGASGVFNIGVVDFENFIATENGRFGLINSAGTLTMDSCEIDHNLWGGIYIGDAGTTTITNSSILYNDGSGFEISEYDFADDFQNDGVKGIAPTINVNNCNIYGNSGSTYDISSSVTSEFLSISNWGTCSSPRPANDGESDVFEIPIGFISIQTVTGLRTYFTSSSYNRNYYLRRAYDDQNIDNYIHSSITPVSCGTYVPKTFSFSAASVPTDRYYWYIGANSTSSHAIYSPVTTIRLGGYEVYSTVGDDVADFNFQGNYWGVVTGVNTLIYNVNDSNIDYVGYNPMEYADAHANIDTSSVQPVIALGNDTIICDGTSITLDAENPGAIYEWSTGSTNQMIPVSTAGVYSVTVTSGTSCLSNADTISINIDPLPGMPATATGSTNLCENPSNTTYNTTGAVDATSYVWEINPPTAGIITGTGTDATVDWENTFSGTVEITVKGVNNCGDGLSSSPLTIIINPLPAAADIPNGDIDLCEDPSNSTYTVTTINNADSYIWEINPAGAGIITGTTFTATVDWENTFTGVITISVYGTNTCGDGTPNSIIATIYQIPPVPTISEISGSLVSSSSTGNQWYLDGNLITGATSQSYTPLQTGFYTVEVTIAGCSSISNDYYFEVTGMANTETTDIFNVFPNPNNGEFLVHLNLEREQNINIQMYSSGGQLVYDKYTEQFKGKLIQQFDIRKYAQGIYMLHVIIDNQSYCKKIIVK